MEKIISGVILMTTLNLNSSINLPSYKNIDFKPKRPNVVLLENGIRLYIEEDKTLPLVRIAVFMRGGKVADPKEKVGLGELFFAAWREGGSKKYSPDEIDKTLEYYAAEISAKINMEDSSISMISHKKSFDKIFDIFSDLIKNPAFDEKKFELKKFEALEMIKRRNDKPQDQAIREAMRMFFGKDHPYGRRTENETINAITRDDMFAYHRENFVGSNMIIVAAGDFNQDEIIKKLKDTFSDIPKGDFKIPDIPQPAIPQSTKIYAINKPLRQSTVVILMEGPKRHDPSEFALSVLSEYMGGGIQSVLGNEIRSKRGLAYSVYSYFGKRDKSGFVLTYVGTKPESVVEAVKQILIEFEKAKKADIKENELEMAKSQIINSFVFRFPTVFDLLEEFAGYDHYGYEKDYLEKYTERINSVSKDEVINVAKKFYSTEKPLIFIVGDTTKSKIEELGSVEFLKED
ncbi:MAG: M16 family metallopeptidase [Elusimicrobiales bacterium]